MINCYEVDGIGTEAGAKGVNAAAAALRKAYPGQSIAISYHGDGLKTRAEVKVERPVARIVPPP